MRRERTWSLIALRTSVNVGPFPRLASARPALPELAGQIAAKPRDALRHRVFWRSHPVDCAERYRPIRQKTFKEFCFKHITEEELRQHAHTASCNQCRHHRIAVVYTQRTRRPHTHRFSSLREPPDFTGHRVAVTNAAMLGEMKRMRGPSVALQIAGRRDQIARHFAKSLHGKE